MSILLSFLLIPELLFAEGFHTSERYLSKHDVLTTLKTLFPRSQETCFERQPTALGYRQKTDGQRTNAPNSSYVRYILRCVKKFAQQDRQWSESHFPKDILVHRSKDMLFKELPIGEQLQLVRFWSEKLLSSQWLQTLEQQKAFQEKVRRQILTKNMDASLFDTVVNLSVAIMTSDEFLKY